MIGGDLNGHFEKDMSGYGVIYGVLGYGIRNLEGERIFEMRSALNMIVCNTFFRKRDSQLIAYTLRPSKTQILY